MSYRRGSAIVLVSLTVVACSGGKSQEQADAQAVQTPAPQVSTSMPRIKPPSSQSQRTLSEGDVLRRLQAAGFSYERLDKTWISPQEHEQLPDEPTSMFSIRLADGQGNAQSMTLLGFERVDHAIEVDRKPINGFAVRNWFFLGTIANHMKNPIVKALS